MIYQRKNLTKIKKYTIFGERHSGTNLIESLFRTYSSIPITWEFGWKHWLGFADKKILNEASDTLFIAIVRNPYDWLAGFFKAPQHLPIKHSKSWLDFLLNEWYSIDNLIMCEILEDRNYINKYRYKNIFELRKYKTHYLRHSLPYLVDNYVFLRYEDLLSEKLIIIDKIFDSFNLDYKFIDQDYYIQNKKSYSLSKDIIDIINSNIDWKIEQTANYSKDR